MADIGKVLDRKANVVANSNQKVGKIIVQTEPYEHYQLKTENGNLYITGNDERATIFGIYYFAEHFLGIDPMFFWSDKEPEKLKKFDWTAIDYESEKPTFKYRGWFINDEDLLYFLCKDHAWPGNLARKRTAGPGIDRQGAAEGGF